MILAISLHNFEDVPTPDRARSFPTRFMPIYTVPEAPCHLVMTLTESWHRLSRGPETTDGGRTTGSPSRRRS